MKFPKLYARSNTGAVLEWQIFVEDDSFYVVSGQVDGLKTTSKPNKCVGKNIGKKNQSSPHEQAQAEALSKWENKNKSGYFEDIKQIDNAFNEPMLCKVYKDYSDKVDWSKGQIVDHKINGICCLITKDGARSRKNEVFHSIPHILEDLKDFFEKNPDAYLHGELIAEGHLTELNRTAEIVAVTRKEKDISQELLEKSRTKIRLVWYDGYNVNFKGKLLNSDSSFSQRRQALAGSLKGLDFCVPVAHKLCLSEEEMIRYANEYMSTGGEGVVIKNPNAGYIHKRSRDSLKFKREESEEFEVIELLEGSGNWAGACKMAICKLRNGETFRTNVEGEREYLKDVWLRRKEWEGGRITVRFQQYSEFSVPQIPYSDLTLRKRYEG